MLKRNTDTFFYANVTSEVTDIKDEYGNLTGEYEITYTEPIEAHGCISPAKRSSYIEQFGIHLDYDKTITMASKPSGMTEDSILWINNSTVDGHDNIIKRIAIWKNSCVLLVKSVDVTKPEEGTTGE